MLLLPYVRSHLDLKIEYHFFEFIASYRESLVEWGNNIVGGLGVMVIRTPSGNAKITLGKCVPCTESK